MKTLWVPSASARAPAKVAVRFTVTVRHCPPGALVVLDATSVQSKSVAASAAGSATLHVKAPSKGTLALTVVATVLVATVAVNVARLVVHRGAAS